MSEKIFFIEEEDIICPICLDCWVGKDPRILPCQHTYCLECLDQLEIINSCIKCPMCSRECKIENGNINKVEKNLFHTFLKQFNPHFSKNQKVVLNITTKTRKHRVDNRELKSKIFSSFF